MAPISIWRYSSIRNFKPNAVQAFYCHKASRNTNSPIPSVTFRSKPRGAPPFGALLQHPIIVSHSSLDSFHLKPFPYGKVNALLPSDFRQQKGEPFGSPFVMFYCLVPLRISLRSYRCLGKNRLGYGRRIRCLHG
jgi:hypothetical protein